jgi:copper chaperone NosL
MKLQFKTLLAILLSISFFSCKEEKIPHIESGIDDCNHCKMIITETNQACGFFHQSEFVTFCSPKCLLADYEKLRKEKSIDKGHIYFGDFEGRKLIRADSTYFLFTNSIITVMNSGILTFKSENSAQLLMKQSDEFVTNWDKFQITAGTPDKIIKVKFFDGLMNPDIFSINKNEFIQLDIENKDRLDEKILFIKGYEDVGMFKFMKENPFLTIRLIADKPGSGFPIMMKGVDQPLGMIKVYGSHTLDEEVM